MGTTFKISIMSAALMLAACQRNTDSTDGKAIADIANADLVQLCERADLQDVVLDIFVEAVFKRNVASAGLLGSIYNQGLSEEKARQETSIENARAKRHSTDQVDCTVDFVADVSSDDNGMSEVKFADAQYSLIQQPDNSYQVVPKKATFFGNVFIDGMSRDAWNAEMKRRGGLRKRPRRQRHWARTAPRTAKHNSRRRPRMAKITLIAIPVRQLLKRRPISAASPRSTVWRLRRMAMDST